MHHIVCLTQGGRKPNLANRSRRRSYGSVEASLSGEASQHRPVLLCGLHLYNLLLQQQCHLLFRSPQLEQRLKQSWLIDQARLPKSRLRSRSPMSLAIDVSEGAYSMRSTSTANHVMSTSVCDATEVAEAAITGLGLVMERWQGSMHRIHVLEPANRSSFPTYSSDGSIRSPQQIL